MVRRHSRVATFSHPFAVPMTTTAICLRVNQHQSPVEDWPCFEIAISFTSVFLGIKHQGRLLVLEARACAKYRPIHLRHSWHIVRLLVAIPTWVLFALLKLVTGVLIICSWCILAKPSVQTLLPPVFRWLAWASPVCLPHRCQYTPAMEYVNGPLHTLRVVPSMIDLDLTVAQVVDEDAGVAGGARALLSGAGHHLDSCARRVSRTRRVREAQARTIR